MAYPASVSCTAPNAASTIQLKATSNDTSVLQNFRYHLFTTPVFGTASLNSITGEFTYTCVYTGYATEQLQWFVWDGHNPGYSSIQVTVNAISSNDTPTIISSSPPPVLSIAAIAGIGAGIALLVIFIGVGMTYIVYRRIIAKKFEETWRKEWIQARIRENPLFVSNSREMLNPLYIPSNN